MQTACVGRLWVETIKWWDRIHRVSSAVGWDQRRQRSCTRCFSFHLAFLFCSSCVRSGRATESSTNISPSTWWGERVALNGVFPGAALKLCTVVVVQVSLRGGCPWCHPEGLCRMRSSLEETDFSVGLETCWCIPPSVKACREHIF